MHRYKLTKTWILLGATGSILMSGCGETTAAPIADTVNADPETTEAMISENETTGAEADPPKATDVIFADVELEYYVPFTDPEHSFCLLNEGAKLPVQMQTGNTCWANSAVTSLESSRYLQTGESITLNPMDIVNNIYFVMNEDEDRDEGLYVTQGEPSSYGGGCELILATMSTKPIDGYLLSDIYANYMGDVESNKKMIRELGAINTSTHHNQGFFPIPFHGYKTQNYKGENPDHIVTLVGWDDDFPAEAFSPVAGQNGAWLAQNSLSTGWGNNGYYWISYDSDLSGVVYIPTDQYRYAQNYGTYPVEVLNTEASEAVYAAVYEINGSLGAIGILSGVDETDLSYTIEILDGEFGEVLLTFSGSEEMTGYHIAELPKALEVGTCTVVVHKQRNIPVEGESQNDAKVALIQPGRVEYVAKSEPGRCFVLIGDKWVDTSSEEIRDTLELDYIPGDLFLPVLYN